MALLLDTHAWIWQVTGQAKLSRRARAAMKKSDCLYIAAISAWEIAMLVEKGRLGLDRDVETWIKQTLCLPKMTYANLSPEIAVLSTRLPGDLHGDPADRMLVATALTLGCALVTKDDRLRAYTGVETVW